MKDMILQEECYSCLPEGRTMFTIIGLKEIWKSTLAQWEIDKHTLYLQEHSAQ